MTTIISGFPGVGKTYFVQNSNLKVNDSDSSKFSWIKKDVRNLSFPLNYINHIKRIFDEYDIILVSSHEIVRQALFENKIDFTIVYPERCLMGEYIERFKNRGSGEAFIAMIHSCWDSFIDDMETQKGCKIVKLNSGEFLSDYLGNAN